MIQRVKQLLLLPAIKAIGRKWRRNEQRLKVDALFEWRAFQLRIQFESILSKDRFNQKILTNFVELYHFAL